MDNENIVNLIATDSPAAEISDSIKNALFSKAAERIEALRPVVAASMFGDDEENTADEE